MGNKQLSKRKKSRKRQLIRFKKTMELTQVIKSGNVKSNIESNPVQSSATTEHANANRQKYIRPKSLAVLCQRVIKKYKLIASPEPKKFTPPETFSVVGGKALRKRSEGSLSRKPRKTYSPRSLAVLCKIVIKEYNLLPESEESLLPTSGSLLVSKNAPSRSRGRPRKGVQKDEPKIKRSRGRPRKDSNLGEIQQPTVLEEEPISYPYIRIKEEPSTSYADPLQDGDDDDDYTVEIKFEADDFTHEEPVFSSPQSIAASQSTVTDPQSRMQVPGSSTGGLLPPTPQFITVVMDEYQIFANRIAEQLRGFPPGRALLLQRGIQAMIDNERELIEEDI